MSANDFESAFEHASLAPPEVVDGAVWVETDPPENDPVLGDVFDAGDKLMVVGPSKARKSFFGLQMAVSLASGRDFLGLPVPKARRVLACQYEIRDGNYHRRLWRLARAAMMTGSDLGDRLGLLNLRGKRAGLDAILAAARNHRADVVIIDPLYKTYAGHDENAVGDMATILAGFDTITEATGGTLAYIHHDAKGPAGARDAREPCIAPKERNESEGAVLRPVFVSQSILIASRSGGYRRRPRNSRDAWFRPAAGRFSLGGRSHEAEEVEVWGDDFRGAWVYKAQVWGACPLEARRH